MNNHFCQIFFNFTHNNSFEKFLTVFSHQLNYPFDRFLYSENDLMMVNIRRNKEYDGNLKSNQWDGFLYYSHFIECDLKQDDKFEDYLNNITDILIFLQKYHIPFVSACDFEEQLHKYQYNDQ